MSAAHWHVSVMTDWTGAGGTVAANLGYADDAQSSIRQELSGRGQATLVLDMDAFDQVAKPVVLRVDVSDTAWYEFRASGRQRNSDGTTCVITARPPVYDLTSADLVREWSNGSRITRFDQTLAPLTPRQIFERFVFTNLVEDRLTWMELLDVESDQELPVVYNRVTRGQVCDDVIQRTQYELLVEQQSNGKQGFSLVRAIGSSAIIVPARFGDRLQAHQQDDDWTRLATIGRIVGDAPTADSDAATIGENLWRVANVRALGPSSTAPFAVELRRIMGTETPVVQDGIFAAPTVRYLQRADGRTRLPIVASRATEAEVDVASDPPVIGEYVAIVANADGDPLELVELPIAIATSGTFVGDVPVAGGRGERNYATNGGHETGLAGWTPVNGSETLRAELRREETGVVFSGAANGSRAAGTGTGTPFAMDGLTPDILLARGDCIEVGGADIGLAADAIPDASGGLTLALLSGIPGDLADGTPITVVRRELRTLYCDGAHSRFSPGLKLKPPGDGGLLPSTGNNGFEPVGATLTQASVALPSFVRVEQPLVGTTNSVGMRVPQWPRAAFAFQGSNSGLPYVDYAFTPTSLPTAVDADTFTCTVDPAFFPGGITTDSVMNVWLDASQQFDAFRFVSRVGSLTTWTRVTGWRDALDFAFPCTLSTFPYWTTFGTINPATRYVTNQTWADNTAFEYARLLETRTWLLDGAHLSGATSIDLKPIAALGTRAWIGGDSVSLQREVSGLTLELDAGGTVTEEYDGMQFIYTAVVPYIAAGSTFDDIPQSEWLSTPGWLAGYLPRFAIAQDATGAGSRQWKLTGLSGGLASFVCVSFTTGDAPDDSDPITAGQTITCLPFRVIDTYVLSSGATFGTNGRASLPISIPAGRTYPRNAPVWANWHGNGAMGASDNAATNLRVNTTVTGSAAALEVFADDAYTRNWNGSSVELRALYRVFASASSLPIPGNRLFIAAPQLVDGSGAASVELTAANVNAIANNEPLTITRPQLLAADERTLGSIMRLFAPVGGTGVPTGSTAGIENLLAYVRVPAGATRVLTAAAEFGLSIGPWTPATGPVVAILDASGTVLASAALASDFGSVGAAPGHVRLACQATVALSGTYQVRVFGGHASDFTMWCGHRQTMLHVGPATDAPYTPGSHASNTMLVGLRPLLEASTTRISDRVTIAECDAAYAAAIGVPAAACPPLVLGGRIDLEDLGREVRITGRTLRPGRETSDVDVGTVTPDSLRALAALAQRAGLGGVR